MQVAARYNARQLCGWRAFLSVGNVDNTGCKTSLCFVWLADQTLLNREYCRIPGKLGARVRDVVFGFTHSANQVRRNHTCTRTLPTMRCGRHDTSLRLRELNSERKTRPHRELSNKTLCVECWMCDVTGEHIRSAWSRTYIITDRGVRVTQPSGQLAWFILVIGNTRSSKHHSTSDI